MEPENGTDEFRVVRRKGNIPSVKMQSSVIYSPHDGGYGKKRLGKIIEIVNEAGEAIRNRQAFSMIRPKRTG